MIVSNIGASALQNITSSERYVTFGTSIRSPSAESIASRRIIDDQNYLKNHVGESRWFWRSSCSSMSNIAVMDTVGDAAFDFVLPSAASMQDHRRPSMTRCKRFGCNRIAKIDAVRLIKATGFGRPKRTCCCSRATTREDPPRRHSVRCRTSQCFGRHRWV